MANPFLNKTDLVDRDIETALLLEQANVLDIGKAVAYTDGDRVFVNTDDNLFNILPAYDQRMLKWLLWHEKMHMELRHHNRFFRYLKELDEEKTLDEFHVTKDEVNVIMDIIVHDWMSKKFPELVDIALENLAQMRNRNSLSYTFKTTTLEEMLKEYADFKHGDSEDKDEQEGDGEGEEDKEDDSKESKGKKKSKEVKKTPHGESEKEKSGKKGHSEGGDGDSEDKEDKPEDKAPEIKDDEQPPEPEPEHDKTDWSKLDDIDSKEFITTDEGDEYMEVIQELKRKKFRLAKLTETLNGLITSTRKRSYAMPSTIHIGSGVMLKGSTPRTYTITPMF